MDINIVSGSTIIVCLSADLVNSAKCLAGQIPDSDVVLSRPGCLENSSATTVIISGHGSRYTLDRYFPDAMVDYLINTLKLPEKVKTIYIFSCESEFIVDGSNYTERLARAFGSYLFKEKPGRKKEDYPVVKTYSYFVPKEYAIEGTTLMLSKNIVVRGCLKEKIDERVKILNEMMVLRKKIEELNKQIFLLNSSDKRAVLEKKQLELNLAKDKYSKLLEELQLAKANYKGDMRAFKEEYKELMLKLEMANKEINELEKSCDELSAISLKMDDQGDMSVAKLEEEVNVLKAEYTQLDAEYVKAHQIILLNSNQVVQSIDYSVDGTFYSVIYPELQFCRAIKSIEADIEEAHVDIKEIDADEELDEEERSEAIGYRKDKLKGFHEELAQSSRKDFIKILDREIIFEKINGNQDRLKSLMDLKNCILFDGMDWIRKNKVELNKPIYIEQLKRYQLYLIAGLFLGNFSKEKMNEAKQIVSEIEALDKALLQPDFDVRLAHKINHVISNIESMLLSRFYLNDLLSQKMLYYNNYMSMTNTIASLELELQKPANERDFSESTLISMLNQNKMQQILNLQYINFYDGLIAFATGTVSIDNYLQLAILNRLNERIDLLINLSKYSMVPDIFSAKPRKDEIDFLMAARKELATASPHECRHVILTLSQKINEPDNKFISKETRLIFESFSDKVDVIFAHQETEKPLNTQLKV